MMKPANRMAEGLGATRIMRRRPGTRGLAIVNIYKLENDKVVEHWDVIQPIPESAANNNGMF